MKRIVVYMLFLIFLCMLIPIIFTNRRIEKVNGELVKNEEVKQEQPKEEYSYKQYGTIKLLHEKTNTVEEIKIDEYLYGVVSSEMPASFEIEALKAQAVAARTYTIYKINNNDKKHGEADICDNSACCQAWISKEDRLQKWNEQSRNEYWAKIVEAVDSTKGKIITYNEKPINAFFHANSGGATEVPVNVWGGSNYPYLQTVATSGEDAYTQYSSEVTVTKEEFKNKIIEKHADLDIDFSKADSIKITEYTEGNRVKNLKVGNLNLSGVEIRNIFGLRSANFKIDIQENNVKFAVIGYGHGVGMSQTGADSLAKQGKKYDEIIKHYYTGVEIKNM